ncbi:class I glutamine amidotransferase-like protein [Astrocystis sublimbata]|nr:class I glutamine amidotransferase-like protein [Astrocystis sublimbata]
MDSHFTHPAPILHANAGTTPAITLQSHAPARPPSGAQDGLTSAAAGRVMAEPDAEPGALRIAILLNSYRSRFLPAIRGSYQRTIGAVAPRAQLAFYEPANRPGEFPNPDYFDCIVLGGSNVDPRKRHPWILEIHDFVRRLVRDYPRKKLLGICWGHQTISAIYGGTVADAPVPEMGVASVDLTTQGREFFHEAADLGSFMLQQHHRREVVAGPHGFTALAHRNQCFLNETNTVLTFQGHPEKDSETARLRLHDSVRWFGFDAVSDEKAWAQLELLINTPHDGEMVWRRILEWILEPPSEPNSGQQGAALTLTEKPSKI